MSRFAKGFLVVVLALSMTACCSLKVEKKSVNDLQATHDLIFPEYISLVEAKYAPAPGDSADDAAKKKEQIERRKRTVQSSNDITGAMKKALGD